MIKLNALEAHNGISAHIVNKSDKYNAVWVSSLTHATAKGLPDNELVPLKERMELVREIKDITDKPIIVDVDTLGGVEHIPYLVRGFSNAGAYAIVIEDKKYPKQNSLLQENKHQLEDVDMFCEKIKTAKQHSYNNLKIIARLESLIAKHSMEEALIRAEAYERAGADAILIHSKQEVDASEVLEFAERYNGKLPLVAVPTTYNLPEDHPFEIVIHANHMMRASIAAMEKAASGEEVELCTVKHIFDELGH